MCSILEGEMKQQRDGSCYRREAEQSTALVERERERGAGEPGSTSKQAGTIEGERGGQGNKHARGQGDV